MPQPLLEGTIHDEGEDDSSAMQRIRQLEAELRSARLDADHARNDAETAQAAIKALRNQLQPLHRALKAVFGEIRIAVGEDESPQPAGDAPPSPANPSNKNPVWEEWKNKLGSACAKIITALQTHDGANINQLVVLTGITRKTTIYDAIFKLNKSGLIDKRDGKTRLKKL